MASSKVFTKLPIPDSSLNAAIVGPGGKNIQKICRQVGDGLKIFLYDGSKKHTDKARFADCNMIRIEANTKKSVHSGINLLKQEIQKIQESKKNDTTTHWCEKLIITGQDKPIQTDLEYNELV